MPGQKKNNKNTKENNPNKPNKPSSRTNNQSSAINKKNQKSNDSSLKTKPGSHPPKNSGNQQKSTGYSQVDNAVQKGSRFLDKANTNSRKIGRTTNRIIDLFEGNTNRKPESLQPFKVLTNLATAKNERLVKAQLRSEDNPNQPIEFMFNPTDLQFNRSVEIKEQEGVKTQKGLPKVNFAFVQAWTLKLSNLLFDTYEQRTDVFKKIQPILDTVDFTKFSGNQTIKRPPVYYFTWGERDYLRCMVNSISYKLTMFLPDGTPVRALVNLDLKEVDDSPTFNIPDPKKDAVAQTSMNILGNRAENAQQIEKGRQKEEKRKKPEKQNKRKNLSGNGKPRTGTPKTGTPKTGNPRTGNPRTGSPKTTRPRTGSPKTTRPRTGSPKTTRPRTGSANKRRGKKE